jgi:pimeloyl-ACP methyl ester carboxylesterase
MAAVLRPLLVVVLLLCACGYPRAQQDTPAAECVILLHGLWRTGLSMKAVEWHLEEAGYAVVNVTYPSTLHAIEALSVIALEEGLAGCRAARLDAGRPEKIHVVSHSLGGILARHYFASHAIEELGRVVMLGPPNQGAAMADYVNSIRALGLFQPKAVGQLGTGETSVPRRLGPVAFELGVIAGNQNLLPFVPGSPEAESDGTVTVAETRVEGMKDFIEMPVGHTFMMWDDSVLDQVLAFLRDGRFARPAQGSDPAPDAAPKGMPQGAEGSTPR